MRYIVHSSLVLLLLCASGWAAAQGGNIYPDPVFGVPVYWNKLPTLKPRIVTDSGGVFYRVLARHMIGKREIIYLWGRVPIRADREGAEIDGYETDAGMLAVSNGAHSFPLGASSGNLANDYPEIKAKVLQELLSDYVSVLIEQVGSGAELGRIVSEGRHCAGLDKLALKSLSDSHVPVVCKALD